MDKNQIIGFIEGQIASGRISKEDLANLIGNVEPTQLEPSQPSVTPVQEYSAPVKEESSNNSNNLTHVFYAIGAIIAIIGVSVLVAQNWDEIGFAGRILVTLGISLVAYIIGLVIKSREQKVLSQVMFTISAVLAPLGSYVLLQQAGVDFSWSTQIFVSLILFVIYGTALLISKRSILILLTAFFGSWAYYSVVMKVFFIDYIDSDILYWASIMLGVAYILIGYGYQTLQKQVDSSERREKRVVLNFLYGFGTIFVLGGGIAIGGAFDLYLIALIFGAFYGSVYLTSRSMLVFASLFLMAHIIKLTGKYFVDSIGWPVALIAVGFFIIAIGYVTFYLNRKFISGK